MEEWLKALPEGVLVELKYEEGPNEFVLRTGFGWSLFGCEEVFDAAQLVSDGVVDGEVVRYEAGSRDEAIRVEEAEFERQSARIMGISSKFDKEQGVVVRIKTYDGGSISDSFEEGEIYKIIKNLSKSRSELQKYLRQEACKVDREKFGPEQLF